MRFHEFSTIIVGTHIYKMISIMYFYGELLYGNIYL